MPVLLAGEEQYARWLNPETVECGPLDDLLRPAADGTLVSYAAS
jgi:putative SOS response-associated peptidase YedK